MTTIKPPDRGSSAGGLTPPDSSAQGPEGAGPSFRELLDPAGGAAGLEKGGLSQFGVAVEASAEPGALAQAVRSGQITSDQALDRLVERTLASVAGTLSQAQQAELRAVLLEAIQVDPALRVLRDALG